MRIEIIYRKTDNRAYFRINDLLHLSRAFHAVKQSEMTNIGSRRYLDYEMTMNLLVAQTKVLQDGPMRKRFNDLIDSLEKVVMSLVYVQSLWNAQQVSIICDHLDIINAEISQIGKSHDKTQ